MATTARQAARDGAKAVLDAYKAANPTRLLHVYDAPPGSFHTPCAFVDKAISETIAFSMGVRQRALTVTLVVLNRQADNAQAAAEQDVLVDGLIDQATTLARTAVSGALLTPASVTDAEREQHGTPYAGFELALLVEFQEGRTV